MNKNEKVYHDYKTSAQRGKDFKIRILRRMKIFIIVLKLRPRRAKNFKCTY